MKQTIKFRLLALVLVLSMVLACGCSETKLGNNKETSGKLTETETTTKGDGSGTGEIDKTDVEYAFSIYDEEGVTYSEEDIKVQETFKKYLDEEYTESIESSYINAIYSLDNIKSYGIEFEEISWGEYSVEYMQGYKAEIEEAINELASFNYDSLDYEGKLIYDTIDIYLKNELVAAEYWYFTENFSPMSGLQSNVPILLAEIAFKDKESLDNYMLLMKDLERYIDDCIEVEKYRATTYGLFITKVGAEDVITQCNDFVNAKENVLITSFEERMKDCTFLTAEEKAAYVSENKDLVNNSVIPAFKNIANMCRMLKNSRKYDSIRQYPNGDKYYEYLVKENASTTATLDELFALTKEYTTNSLSTIEKIASKDTTAVYEFYYGEYPVTDPKESLSYFAKMLEKDFPKAVTTNYELKYVPKSLESSSSPAFYIIAPIDNPDKNIIYINGSEEYAGEDLYAVLAHEGFPGHLYQTTYFYSVNPHPIRTVLSFKGYDEGYAMYTERYAYDYSGFTANTIEMLKANDVYGYGIYSLIDFYVNYEGWTYDQVEKYIVGEGYSKDAAKEIYYIMLDDPCIYHRYFLGLVQYLEAYDSAKALLGDKFTNINFNKYMLEIGPTYFSVIEERMKAWAERVK